MVVVADLVADHLAGQHHVKGEGQGLGVGRQALDARGAGVAALAAVRIGDHRRDLALGGLRAAEDVLDVAEHGSVVARPGALADLAQLAGQDLLALAEGVRLVAVGVLEEVAIAGQLGIGGQLGGLALGQARPFHAEELQVLAAAHQGLLHLLHEGAPGGIVALCGELQLGVDHQLPAPLLDLLQVLEGLEQGGHAHLGDLAAVGLAEGLGGPGVGLEVPLDLRVVLAGVQFAEIPVDLFHVDLLGRLLGACLGHRRLPRDGGYSRG